jgi:hypothetical protein
MDRSAWVSSIQYRSRVAKIPARAVGLSWLWIFSKPPGTATAHSRSLVATAKPPFMLLYSIVRLESFPTAGCTPTRNGSYFPLPWAKTSFGHCKNPHLELRREFFRVQPGIIVALAICAAPSGLLDECGELQRVTSAARASMLWSGG